MKSNQTGDIGELAFMLEATSKGFLVCKPFGQAEAYDFILDNGNRLFKVQVKASNRLIDKHGYSFYSFGNGEKSSISNLGKIDIIVCYNVDTKSIYIIPANLLKAPKVSMGLKSKYEIYKNNWSVFK